MFNKFTNRVIILVMNSALEPIELL